MILHGQHEVHEGDWQLHYIIFADIELSGSSRVFVKIRELGNDTMRASSKLVAFSSDPQCANELLQSALRGSMCICEVGSELGWLLLHESPTVFCQVDVSLRKSTKLQEKHQDTGKL